MEIFYDSEGYADTRKDEPKKLRTEHPKTASGCGSGCDCLAGRCGGVHCSTPNIPCEDKTKRRLGPPQRTVPGGGINWKQGTDITPISHNQSPIDNIIQGIGDFLTGRHPIGAVTSPIPIEQAPMIPVGYARQQKKLPQNVPYSQWAPQMWKQFTDLASNFDSNFATSVHNLISQIPCGECKTDADSYIKSHPPENVKSKAQAQQWVQSYHSHVDSIKKGWGREDPWYSTMWATLHYQADNFNPLTFADNVRHQIDQIPCPPCSTHSLEFMTKYPPENVKTRSQAMYWMCKLHNMASYYAGNEIVDCSIDPEGYGYLSGHRDYENNFFYGKGGGGRGRGGGRQRGGHQHGGQGQGQQQDDQQQGHHRRGRGGKGRGFT